MIDKCNRPKKLDDREAISAEDLPDDLLHELKAKIEESKASGVVETDCKVVQF